MRRSRQLPFALFALVAFVASGIPKPRAARAEDVIGGGEPSRIVNGITTHAYPTTGALLVGTNPGNAQLQCSGTLIGCKTFLSAGHCVAGDSNPAHYFVYLQNAGVFSVTAVAPHDDYRDDRDGGGTARRPITLPSGSQASVPPHGRRNTGSPMPAIVASTASTSATP